MINQNNYEEEVDNRGSIKIIINDISTFLYKSGFLSKYLVDKKQIELLESNSQNDFVDIFEYNRSISSNDVSKKYSNLISSINSLFKSEVQYKFEIIYYQYLEYTKTNISVNVFLNSLIMLNYIVNNFNNLLNLSEDYDLIKAFQLEKKISIIEINNLDNINPKNETLSSKLEKIYENINNKPTYKDQPVNKNLIILIYLLSLDGKITVDRDIPNLSNLITKFGIYNKIYISNIYISVMQYIQMVLIINLYVKSNKSKKNFLVYNISYSNHYYDFALNDTTPDMTNIKTNDYFNNKTQLLSTGRNFKYNLNDNNIMKIDDEKNKQNNEFEIPNCYLFDDNIINYPENNGIKLIFFQNFLKFFSFYHMSKNRIKFTMNLSIESICELSNHFINKKDEFANDKSDILIFEELDDLLLNAMNINDLEILTRENINILFNSFNFKELLIKFMDFKSQQQVENINNKYLDLISKSNNCYLQEPIISVVKNRKDIKHKGLNIVENLTMKDLYVQYNILIYYLELYHKNKDFKKTPKTIIIKFNTFKFIFNREKKNIQIFFSFSSIKEKTLFHYLKISSNILKLEQKYEEIISYLKEYKLYDSTIRLYQSNFRSHQVSFFFTLITKKLADFLEENKFNNKITILEMKFNTFNPNMQVYIKDENMKQKNRQNLIKQMISNSYYSSKINVLNNYIEELTKYWNLIVISDKGNDFKLLRTFEDNKIFFYISRDKSITMYNSISIENNVTSVSSSNINNEEKKNEGYEYLNIIMYFKNDEEIFEKGFQFMDNLQEDKNSILEYKTTLICDRFYLESNILTEPRMKKTVKTMYNVIDDLFMIAKNIKSDNDGNENEENDQDNDYYNYDIYIAENFIAVSNYHLYDYKKDINYSKIIFEFLSTLSSCIELILYILKNKDIYISKFVYLIRTIKDDYYIFEYKNSNMFIKKVKEFDSLININVKECYPLFCFISKKTETKYTISNDNFYDVYLRLFLNLNKVVETKEKLNEIFLQKVHKNIFYEYYDSFLLIAYSFEAFNYFNDFLMKNNYLSITKGEKFDRSYILLSEEISRKKNYKILMDNLKTNNSILTKKLIIFNFNFMPSYFASHRKLFFMSYQKAEYLLNEEINQIKLKIIPKLNNNLDAISKIFVNKNLDKDKIKNIVGRIKNFMVGGEIISLYNSSTKDFENILDDYYKEKAKIKTQKVEMRVYQLTEEAKNTQNNKLNHKKKNCEIF